MSIVVFILASYVTVFTVLVIGITIGLASWVIAVTAFLLLLLLALGRGAGPR